jgi:hypothetical protein
VMRASFALPRLYVVPERADRPVIVLGIPARAESPLTQDVGGPGTRATAGAFPSHATWTGGAMSLPWRHAASESARSALLCGGCGAPGGASVRREAEEDWSRSK